MIGVAVIGYGTMGKNHARVYDELDSSQLVAVVDTNPELAQKAANRFGCQSFSTITAILNNPTISAVSVAVSTNHHAEITLACLKAGKHVLVEKPIAATVVQAKRMIRIAKKANLILTVGHIERFNPAVQTLYRLIQDGRLGDITSLVTKRVGGFPPQIKDANVIIDLAVHDIDICNFLLSQQPNKVICYKNRVHIKNREDSAELFLHYRHASAFIQVNWITPVKIRHLAVTGTKGYCELNYVTQKLTLYETNFEKKVTTFQEGFSNFIMTFGEPEKTEVQVDSREPLKEELRHFIKAIESGDSSALVSPEDGLAALTTALTASGAKG